MSFVNKKNAQLFLFINAFLWGSSYVWSKMLLSYMPRFSILAICSLGGLVSTVILFFPQLKYIKAGSLLSSAAVSMFSILSNTFFMLALQYTSSSNTAFIVQTSVVITPILMAVFERKLPEKRILLCALTALLGLFMLTCDFQNFRLNTGDLLALGNALFFSLFLTGLKFNSRKVEPVHFTFIHHTTNTIGFLLLAIFLESHMIKVQKLISPVFVVLISASVIIAAVTVLVQSTAIKFARPEKATIIYTFEPVAALLLASVFIGERLDGIKAIVGCVLILLSVLYSVYKPKVREKGVATFSNLSNSSIR